MVNASRRSHLSYDQFIKLCSLARKRLNLSRPKRSRHLPQIIPDDALKRFYQIIDQDKNAKYQLMLRLLLFCGVRVSELVNIMISDVDLNGQKIFIRSGKGDKDRYVLFPKQFRLALQLHINTNPDNRYLFESNRRKQFSTRMVQYIVNDYAEAAQLPVKCHPHTLRHQLLTFLTKEGLTDAQIQLISGHSSKKSLEVYQHLSLVDVSDSYQQAMQKLGV